MRGAVVSAAARETVSIARSRDDDGWIVRDESGRVFFSDGGGSWDINPNGTLGRQRQGRLDVRAPKSPAAMRRFVAGMVMGNGKRIEVQS